MLAERVGSVVLISGRPGRAAAGAQRACARASPARRQLTVLAQYGLERWDGGTGELSSPPPLPGVEGARRELAALLADPLDAARGFGRGQGSGARRPHPAHAPIPTGSSTPSAPSRRNRANGRARAAPGPQRAGAAAARLREGRCALRFVAERRVAERCSSSVTTSATSRPSTRSTRAARARACPGLGVVSDSAEVDRTSRAGRPLLDGPPAVVSFLRELAEATG